MPSVSATAPVAVVYDRGSVSAGELAAGLADVAPLVLVTAESAHTARMRPVLEQIGEVLPIGGTPEDTQRALARWRPQGILTFAESMIGTTAELAAGLGLPYHTPETARLLTDKAEQRHRLGVTAVDTVRARRVTTAAEWQDALRHCGLPAVTKPVRGEGSRETWAIPDRAASAEVYERLFVAGSAREPLLVEELLQGRPSSPYGDYVSVETASHHGEVTPIAVTGKYPLLPPFREVGQFWPVHLGESEQAVLTALASAAVKALGVTTGICHTEIKLTPAGPRIIEVNGRLGGHLNELARRSCGVDLVRTAVTLALGRPLPHGALSPRSVYFQYNSPVPENACRLVATVGAASVRAVPGVTGYRPYVRPGEVLAGGTGTQPLDLLTGVAPDHPTAMGVLDKALSRLSHVFADQYGRTWTTTNAVHSSGPSTES
jgi:biotin carboxylase